MCAIRVHMSTDANATATMCACAEACVRQNPLLDYTRASLAAFDRVVGATAAELRAAVDRGAGPTPRQYQALVMMYGGYLGEVIRRHLGGTWHVADSSAVLGYRGVELRPVEKIDKRLRSPADDLVAFVDFIETQPPWDELLRLPADLDAGTDYATVLIVPRTCLESDATRVLGPVMDRARFYTTWTWIDDVGASFSAAVWRLSSNGFVRDEDTHLAIVDDYLSAGMAELHPVFAFFTFSAMYAARAQLRRTFQDLERADWAAILRPRHARMLVP